MVTVFIHVSNDIIDVEHYTIVRHPLGLENTRPFDNPIVSFPVEFNELRYGLGHSLGSIDEPRTICINLLRRLFALEEQFGSRHLSRETVIYMTRRDMPEQRAHDMKMINAVLKSHEEGVEDVQIVEVRDELLSLPAVSMRSYFSEMAS